MSEKNKVTVNIYGQQYTIKGTASTSHMRAVTSYVDEKMIEIGDANSKLDARKIAVLAAVNISDEYFRLKDEYEALLRIIEQHGIE